MSYVIRTVAVVGAGEVGRRLAGLAARAGYRTILEDLSGRRRVQLAADPELAGVEIGADLEHVASQADLVLEAAPDDFETKFEVYRILEQAAPRPSIFVASSADWPVAEIASLTYRGPQVLGLAVRPEGIEVVRGPESSAEAWQAVTDFARSLPTWNART